MNSVRLSLLTIPEIKAIESNANFTEDELNVFRMRCKAYSTIKIAQAINVSTRTIERIYERIMRKIDGVGYYVVPIENKLLLTVNEASALSGLSVAKINQMIAATKYKSMLLICENEALIKRTVFQNILETEQEV